MLCCTTPNSPGLATLPSGQPPTYGREVAPEPTELHLAAELDLQLTVYILVPIKILISHLFALCRLQFVVVDAHPLIVVGAAVVLGHQVCPHPSPGGQPVGHHHTGWLHELAISRQVGVKGAVVDEKCSLCGDQTAGQGQEVVE